MSHLTTIPASPATSTSVPVRVGSTVAHRTPFVTVHTDRLVLPSGGEQSWTRFEVGSHDGVAILPVAGGLVGLVEQYRNGVDAVMHEIPRGMGESDDPVENARRELVEETGLTPIAMIGLGRMRPDSAVLDTTVDLFLAEIAPGPEGLPPVEAVAEPGCSLIWMRLGDALTAVATGELTDAFTCVALSRAHLRGLI